MLKYTKTFLKQNYKISDKALALYEKSIKDIENQLKDLDDIKEFNQAKVLNAFQQERISESHFTNSTGYAYDDIGRDSLDKIFAKIFNTESAIVRPHFVNGTHAIGTALFGNLRPGDTMISVCGNPYDTLYEIIGINKKKDTGSLKDFGVHYKQLELKNGRVDIESLTNLLKIDESIKLVHIQRSTGYGWRKALSINEIKEIIESIKSIRKDVICFVDNCYGEFVETSEPTDVGADLMAGSLIKNIGGGIAPTGGYIVGKKDLVQNSSYRMTVPGIGGECGATLGVVRLMYQGLFLAPHIVAEALKGATLCSRMMELAGFEVLPKYDEKRSDIIQSIKFKDKDNLIKFCNSIQKSSPVDSFVSCEPWDMPGYEDQVIMAAGTFVQGASIELTADGPIRDPYIAYMQGGLTFEHVKIATLMALSNILK